MKQRFRPRLRAELRELRAALAGTAAGRAPVELGQQSVSRLSRQDALRMQAKAAQEACRAACARVIEAALHRPDTGEFGWYDTGGEPIGERRPELDPTLARCVGSAR